MDRDGLAEELLDSRNEGVVAGEAQATVGVVCSLKAAGQRRGIVRLRCLDALLLEQTFPQLPVLDGLVDSILVEWRVFPSGSCIPINFREEAVPCWGSGIGLLGVVVPLTVTSDE